MIGGVISIIGSGLLFHDWWCYLHYWVLTPLMIDNVIPIPLRIIYLLFHVDFSSSSFNISSIFFLLLNQILSIFFINP